MTKTEGHKLVDLLDYMEQVVRLDERVALRVADYRLADGTHLAVRDQEIDGLPGIALDQRDDDGSVWLSIERFSRSTPPAPPVGLLPWIVSSTDPAATPTVLHERLEIVSAIERDAMLASDRAAEEDLAPVPEALGGAEALPRFHRTLRLSDTPAVAEDIEVWIAGPWQRWADEEAPRRRTIAIYGRLYKLQQLLDLGGTETTLEAVWGIGPVQWTREGRSIDRPFIEQLVELELDPSGTIRLRPREANARVDFKPYEAFDCPNLPQLERMVQAEIARAGEDDGISPWRHDSFEPILMAAAARLASNGRYARGPHSDLNDLDAPSISDGWVLFARPRSQHVVLDDIARFRTLAREGAEIHGLAQRLVNPPSDHGTTDWTPLGSMLGMSPDGETPPPDQMASDVFFPKPFNDDQIAIVRRLAKSDGLVVQGPPGTGKTHTIANLICHAMALGQSVLVVSRGEAALSVLRDQLPEKIQPLTIALLASERQGMRQVEAAIREIQSVVEESRPEIRLSAIRRCDSEIVKIRHRMAAIDVELEAIAQHQTAPIGPGAVAPADLARKLDTARDTHSWFTDRPLSFVQDTGLTDEIMTALAEARQEAGDLLDHGDTALPDLDALPRAETAACWHEDLVRARSVATTAAQGPAPDLHIAPDRIEDADRAVKALRDLAASWEDALRLRWIEPYLNLAARREASPWLDMLREIASEYWEVETERIRLASFAVEMPDDILADEAARAAVLRAAPGDRAFGRLSFSRAASRGLVAEIRVRGLPPGQDKTLWEAVAARITLRERRLALDARWRSFAVEAGSPAGDDRGEPGPIAQALAQLDRCRTTLDDFRDVPALETIALDPDLARAFAARIEAALVVTRLAAADAARMRVVAAFTGEDRTSTMGRQFFAHLVGREDVETERLGAIYSSLLARIDSVHAKASCFAVVRALCERISDAGAPDWAARLRTEPTADDGDALLPTDWREAWDHGAADRHLGQIDGRSMMLQLSREREALDRRSRKLLVELVRERAFHTLERRLSPRVKSALVEYVRALGRLGKGTGKGAGHHRRAAREAMARCYEAIPCWIMPTWRVAELLPSRLATFDLVILDEASQSDVTELPALLRGRKILAVGDDRQVSPTPPFVSLGKIEQLRHRYLKDLPFKSLLEPGESLYDLMRAVYSDSRLMLKEHFRCVEPIIRFSMQFYPEKLIPLRIPSAQERIDPPLVDIYVPHGTRDGARKINRAEAEVIVEEIANIATDPDQATRSIGVISLIGGEQAELVRVSLSERIGDEAMQRHRILCGDSATFQGNERDIVFLSLVADRHHRSTLTMLRYEQRFNVAVSRARDRLVLVRSVPPEDLNPKDLKARLIAHFQDPMPVRSAPSGDLYALCDSDFERDVMRALILRGYQVEPQVGAEGFRIDLVVEGAEGRRLAVECDGDSFHGPDRWREDMRRQRILERVGWRFWRCFASNFYRDPNGTLADLMETLNQEGIAPSSLTGTGTDRHLTERRVVAPPTALRAEPSPKAAHGMKPGDEVALIFEDRKRLTLRLTETIDDEARGLVAIGTPLGAILVKAEEGDEIAVPQFSGPPAKAVVETVTRGEPPPTLPFV